ncbi:MAG: M2 family metallopeptidase [Mizugakiibacter sp.]|uniref:M2 family metallopeptidase n=1 Tax=Mizugakiibacter sp. TaxID=1972610 RepID=UPI0031C115F9|nr:M2 family metallopeptidase [Xanthomonadaceae bacterium]
MKPMHASLALAVALALAACSSSKAPETSAQAPARAAPTAAEAHAFVAQMNKDYKAQSLEPAAAEWVAETYITGDTQMLTAKAQERYLKWLSDEIGRARPYEAAAGIEPADKRALQLLKLQTAIPAPKNPAHLTELTTLASRLTAAYGAGKYCTDANDPKTCRNLDDASKILAEDRDWNDDLAAWQGWHSVGRGMRGDYVRFVELLNEGAKDLGYDNVGTMWRAGYDMSPADFNAETDRLWSQVKPLYSQLQCYVRRRLKDQYGDRMPADGTIPAHVTGNMWAQDWSNIYSLVQPYPGAGSLDVDARLQAGRDAEYRKLLAAFKGKPTADDLAALDRQADAGNALVMVKRAEDFYTSIGFPALPASFFEKSMFLRPRDRDALCHASAWPMNFATDVRFKMCIRPTAEDQYTVYHEMGHIYYFLAYKDQPPIFQGGANDGFHEAIGDTIRLNLTPAYLHRIGLAGAASEDEKAVINAQMKLALEKVAFLPFGLLIDKWRWGVFDGSIKPAQYNTAWWELRRKYQGVSAPVARDAADFDPGAKNHVPTNVPYMRYFLADILQFQFQRALCKDAGFDGPLYQCSIYGNKDAGAKFWRMLGAGASEPWQQTLKTLTGKDDMDASAIIDYFQPLHAWLQEQNKGVDCGWTGEG